MQITIIAVGHKMNDWIEDGFKTYAKRMPSEYHFTLKEIKPILRKSNQSVEQSMAQEAKKISDAIPPGAFIVALDERGKDIKTLELANFLQKQSQNGQDIVFVIGGADGLDATFKKNANLLLRLSSLTLPHGLVRVLLAEQLYRAFSVLQNHPYHRA